MARLGPFAQYLQQLSDQLEIARWGSYQLDTLTPEVAHASAMLLGLAVRGDLARPVIRQLVSLLDGKTQVLREALAYLEQVDQDQAIEAIASCLDTEQLAFVLMQAQDVMLDVDEPTEGEQAILDRLRERYDGSGALMSTSLVTIKHKNSFSSLGPFEMPQNDVSTKSSASKPAPMPAPQVLAESLLRITVADSVVDPQQLTYLGEVISRYPGLQGLAVQQARKVTTEQFILQVRGLLTPNQALCVLCQCAHLIFIEGRGSQPKWQVFRQLRDAWGLSERDMVVHLGTLKFNASRLISRRDENAQPSAWGMRQDDWAAMKNGQGRPSARGGRGATDEDGDVIRRSGDDNAGAVSQRPRGSSAMHRGPIPAPRAASTPVASPRRAPAPSPGQAPAPAATAPARKPAPVAQPASATVKSEAASDAPAPSSGQTTAIVDNNKATSATAGDETPNVSRSSEVAAVAHDDQLPVASDDGMPDSESPLQAGSGEAVQSESQAEDDLPVSQQAASAAEAPTGLHGEEQAQDIPPNPTEQGGAAAAYQEPSSAPQTASESPAGSAGGASTGPTPAASQTPQNAASSQATPSSAPAPANGAPAAASQPQSSAPAAAAPSGSTPATSAAGGASPVGTPATGGGADGASQVPSGPAPASSASASADATGPTTSPSGQQAREQGQARTEEPATSRADREPSASSAGNDLPAADVSSPSQPDKTANPGNHADSEKTAAVSSPQDRGHGPDANAPAADNPTIQPAHAEPTRDHAGTGPSAPKPDNALAGTVPVNNVQAPDQAGTHPQSTDSVQSSAPVVAPASMATETNSPSAIVSGNAHTVAPGSATSGSGADANIQNVPTDRSGVPQNAALPREALTDDNVSAPTAASTDENQAVGSEAVLSNRVALPQDDTEDRFEGAEPARDQHEKMISEEAPPIDHTVKLASDQDDANHQAVVEADSTDNVQTIETDASDENRQLLDAAPNTENRQTLAPEDSEPNRQRVDLPEVACGNLQRIPAGADPDKLMPQIKPAAGRAIAPPPLREAEKVHTRVFESWQSVAQKEPEVVRKKAGFPAQIPPTIHRQRVIDFSSINVFLEYESDPQEEGEAVDESGTPLEKKRDYDYKLQTCLDILRQQQDLVKDKLQRVQTRR